jgi:hypothetical protein
MAKIHVPVLSRPSRTRIATEDPPLYGVAMLKIALELKKSKGAGLEDVLPRVLSAMGLDERAFRHFLQRNGGLLRTLIPRTSSTGAG